MTPTEILSLVASGEMSPDDAAAALAAASAKPLFLKVSEKGAISVYGLQRMPVTLYGQQWERLLSFAPTIREFISENRGRLATKGSAPPAPPAPAGGLAAALAARTKTKK